MAALDPAAILRPMSDFHFERDHADDSVLKPILLALAGLVAFAAVLITIAFLAGSVFS